MSHLLCSFKYGFSINLFAASIFEVVYAITHLWFKYFLLTWHVVKQVLVWTQKTGTKFVICKHRLTQCFTNHGLR